MLKLQVCAVGSARLFHLNKDLWMLRWEAEGEVDAAVLYGILWPYHIRIGRIPTEFGHNGCDDTEGYGLFVMISSLLEISHDRFDCLF